MQQDLLQQFSNSLWDKQENLRFFTPLHKKIVERQKGILKTEEYKKEVRAADCPVQPYPDPELEWQQLPMDEQQKRHQDVDMVLHILMETRHLPATHQQLRGCGNTLSHRGRTMSMISLFLPNNSHQVFFFLLFPSQLNKLMSNEPSPWAQTALRPSLCVWNHNILPFVGLYQVSFSYYFNGHFFWFQVLPDLHDACPSSSLS